MKKICEKIKDELSIYLDGMLDVADAQRIAQHLKDCRDCAHELASLRAMKNELGALEPVPAPDDFLEKLHAKIETEKPVKRMLRSLFLPFRMKIPLQFATAAVLAVIIFFVVNTPEIKEQMEDRGPRVPDKTMIPLEEDNAAVGDTVTSGKNESLTVTTEAEQSPLPAKPAPATVRRARVKKEVLKKTKTAGSAAKKEMSVRKPRAVETPAALDAVEADSARWAKLSADQTPPVVLVLKPDGFKKAGEFRTAKESAVMKDKDEEKQAVPEEGAGTPAGSTGFSPVASKGIARERRAEPQTVSEMKSDGGDEAKMKVTASRLEAAESPSEDTFGKVKKLVQRLGGTVASPVSDKADPRIRILQVQLPAKQYHRLVDELNRIGTLQPSPPALTSPPECIRVCIRILPAM